MTSPKTDNLGWRHWFNSDGKYHRVDGPACIGPDGIQEWWVNGKQTFNNRQFQKATNLTDEDMIAIILKYGNIT